MTRLDRVQVDPRRAVVTVDGREVRFGVVSARVLHLIHRAHPRPVRTEAIVADVWPRAEHRRARHLLYALLCKANRKLAAAGLRVAGSRRWGYWLVQESGTGPGGAP